jgi:hypoxanthine phosphoribosyltransferase
MNAPPILLSTDQIQERIASLAREIERDHQGAETLHLVCVLKGAFVFLSDLARALRIPCTLDFMAVSSYAAGTTTTGEVRLLKDLDNALDGRHVVVVEDIIDTGLTIAYILSLLRARNARSLRICALLDKPSRRRVEAVADYVGFTIEDKFVVGYGLDCAQEYRNLASLCELVEAPGEAPG